MKTCKQQHIGTIIIGYTKEFQQKPRLGRKNNRKFTNMLYGQFIEKLHYKGILHGIRVIEQEESYTSKSSFLDQDTLPTYKDDKEEEYTFSGKRIDRDTYQAGDGTRIHADVNGAANILRKAVQNIKELNYNF